MRAGPSYRHTAAHYARLAARYDRHWRAYNERTLTVAMEALSLAGGELVLDVGCGTGELERLSVARGGRSRLVGVDVAPGMLAVAQQKLAGQPQVSFHVASAEALPFASATFDAVVSANMLHRLTEPDRFFAECARVLRPRGRFVLVDWCGDFWRCRLMHYWLRASDRTYARMWRLSQVQAQLSRCGLTAQRTRRFVAPPAYGMMLVVAGTSDTEGGTP